jgi:3-deoxy-D-manno-octulosonic acid kinase
MRRYLRGGFVRHFVQELYWGWLPRPLVELVYTEEIRQRGVPVVEVLGACIEWLGGFFYRGALLTREAYGFVNLWQWLNGGPQGLERQEIICRVARTVKQMHNAGVDHRDLNLTNILVRWTEEEAEVCLIDFDRARLNAGPLGWRQRRKNLARLRRSLHKLDPFGRVSAAADVARFCRAYQEGD